MPSKGDRAIKEDHRPLAVAFMPLETRREAILHLAATADRLGYHTLFLPETWSHDVTVFARGSAVVPPEADALLEQLTVFGTPEAARARLARWHECGADLPIVMLRPNLTNEQISFELEALCAEPAASRLPTGRPTLPAAQRTTLGVGEAVI